MMKMNVLYPSPLFHVDTSPEERGLYDSLAPVALNLIWIKDGQRATHVYDPDYGMMKVNEQGVLREHWRYIQSKEDRK